MTDHLAPALVLDEYSGVICVEFTHVCPGNNGNIWSFTKLLGFILTDTLTDVASLLLLGPRMNGTELQLCKPLRYDSYVPLEPDR